MKLFLQYSCRLLGQWKKTYGLITFLLVVVTTLGFMGTKVVLPTWAWVLLLVLSLYFGTLLVYREIVEQLPKVADLVIGCKNARIGTKGWGRAMPSQPLLMRVDLELRNRGEEKAKLSEVRVMKCDFGTDSLKARVDEIQFYEKTPDVGRRRAQIPLEIPGRDWASMTCELPMDLLESSSDEFARLLKDLQSFEAELHYEYEDMDGFTHSGSVLITGSFEAFRNQAIDNWRTKQEHRLVYIVHDIPQ